MIELIRGLGRVRRLAPAAAILLVMANAPALLAQEVRGTVRDSASRQPLPNTVVLVLDPSGRPAARGTTDQQGHFRLVPWGGRPTPKAARTASALRLRVLRMGFRPHEVPLATVAGGTAVDIALVSFPINLEEVQVIAAPSCPQRPDRPAALALLRQVRLALYANVVARSQNSATITRLLYARRFDAESGRITGQTVRTSVTSATGEPFDAARSASAFDREGFRDDGVGVASEVAPDAESLINEEFTENHCFRIMPPDRTRPRQVALGFEPAAREDTGHIDIVGTLWVDTLSRVLRDLTFRYVGLDRQTSALGPEGRLSFRELPNGVVLVDRWSLRLASAGGDGPADRAGEGTSNVARSTAHEIGGEIGSASWPDGFTWSPPLGALRLRVVDGRGRPVPSSTVQLVGADNPSRMEGDGTFVVTGLLPGPYAVSLRDPRLAELDVPSTTTFRFYAARDSTIDARVRVETADDYAVKRCGADARPGKATLLGRVVSADGRPMSEARWSIRDEFGTALVEGGRVDADGLFHWCQLTVSKPVTIDVWRGDRRASTSRLVTDELTTLRMVLSP